MLVSAASRQSTCAGPGGLAGASRANAVSRMLVAQCQDLDSSLLMARPASLALKEAAGLGATPTGRRTPEPTGSDEADFRAGKQGPPYL